MDLSHNPGSCLQKVSLHYIGSSLLCLGSVSRPVLSFPNIHIAEPTLLSVLANTLYCAWINKRKRDGAYDKVDQECPAL